MLLVLSPNHINIGDVKSCFSSSSCGHLCLSKPLLYFHKAVASDCLFTPTYFLKHGVMGATGQLPQKSSKTLASGVFIKADQTENVFVLINLKSFQESPFMKRFYQPKGSLGSKPGSQTTALLKSFIICLIFSPGTIHLLQNHLPRFHLFWKIIITGILLIIGKNLKEHICKRFL